MDIVGERKSVNLGLVCDLSDDLIRSFAGNPLDRSVGDKKNEALLDEILQDTTTRAVVVASSSNGSKKVLCSKIANTTALEFMSIDETLEISGKSVYSELLIECVVFILGKSRTNIWIVGIDVNQTKNDYEKDGIKYNFMDGRTMLTSMLPKAEIAIGGQAISMSKWHATSKFDSINGMPTRPVECGLKRKCIDNDTSLKLYPRIDPVVIAAVISPDRSKILLGKMKAMPTGFYSCLSGFIEPCETIQEAVRREVREESGVIVGEVSIIDSQPWPIGRSGNCELMIACIAYATSSEINIQDHDVEDVQWFERDHIEQMVQESRERVGFLPPDIISNPRPFIPGQFAIAHFLVNEFLKLCPPLK